MNNFDKNIYNVDVLFWANLLPNKKGSFEDYICHLASECTKNSINIKFVLGNDISNSVKCLFKEFGVKYYALQKTDLNSVKAMAKILKETRPELVHFHFFPTCSFLIPVCRFMGVKKIILTDHNSRPIICKKSVMDTLLHPVKQIRRRFFAGMVDNFIAVSGFVANQLMTENKIPDKKITVIYNGIDVERFSPSVMKDQEKRELFRINGSKFVVSYIGQLIHEKGVFIFIDAAQMLLKKRKDILFVIAGEGHLTPIFTDV